MQTVIDRVNKMKLKQVAEKTDYFMLVVRHENILTDGRKTYRSIALGITTPIPEHY